MIDVEARARRAGEAARVEAAERVHALQVPARRSDRTRERRVARPLAGALIGALVVLLIVLLSGGPQLPGTVTIEPAAPDLGDVVSEPVAVDGVLPVPPIGEVIAAYLEDGTPVFVSHPAESEVHVLGAASPRTLRWQRRLVAWCPSSGQFEDLRGDGRFNAWGDYTGGPPPSALTDHPAIVSDDGRTVRLTGENTQVRARTDRRAERPIEGPPCETGTQDDLVTEPVVVHQAPDETPRLDGSEIRGDRWIWATVRVGGAPGDPRVCDLDDTCPASSPRLAGTLGGVDIGVVDAVVTGLVRDTEDGVYVLTDAIPDPELDRRLYEAYETGDPALLPLPGPGEVLADWYGPDRAPVFVTRDHDDAVHVVHAASPGHPSLVGWCPAGETFLDGSGSRWAAPDDERVLASSRLAHYPAEVVVQGELGGVRVVGELERLLEPEGAETELERSSPLPAGSASQCDTDQLVRHLPRRDQSVQERGVLGGTDAPWTWVRMALDEVDGELRLCAVNGPEACGVPELDHDPTNADCFDDIGEAGLCPPAEDPVVVTHGVAPTDGPVLMLVRGSVDGSEVEVRFPAEFDGA